jgi:hypothetical protein
LLCTRKLIIACFGVNDAKPSMAWLNEATSARLTFAGMVNR